MIRVRLRLPAPAPAALSLPRSQKEKMSRIMQVFATRLLYPSIQRSANRSFYAASCMTGQLLRCNPFKESSTAFRVLPGLRNHNLNLMRISCLSYKSKYRNALSNCPYLLICDMQIVYLPNWRGVLLLSMRSMLKDRVQNSIRIHLALIFACSFQSAMDQVHVMV